MSSGRVLTPIAGVVIADYGIVPTLATIYFVGGILMTAMFFIRNRYTDETEVGKELMGLHSKTRVLQSLGSSLRLFGKSFYKRRLFPIVMPIHSGSYNRKVISAPISIKPGLSMCCIPSCS